MCGGMPFFEHAAEVIGAVIELENFDERIPSGRTCQFMRDQVKLVFSDGLDLHRGARGSGPIEERNTGLARDIESNHAQPKDLTWTLASVARVPPDSQQAGDVGCDADGDRHCCTNR